jgi:tetratricopeptide (TPR) repeat protein
VASSQPQATQAPQPANPVVAPVLQSPFTLVRLATYGEPSPWWHGVLAGILCGFLYLSSAVWRYLPIQGMAPRQPLAFSSDTGVEAAKSMEGPTDLASWESEIKKALALTDIGRQEEALLLRQEAESVREKATADRQQTSAGGPELKGQLNYDEVAEAIREKVKREPDSWMAHTEQARVALAGGDYDVAIKEIKLAMTVAPEKMKPQLDKIIMQLDKNMSTKQRAAYG